MVWRVHVSFGAPQNLACADLGAAVDDVTAFAVLSSGNIKIADFGVSAYAPKGKCNSFIGSPSWMAPEVIMCEQKPEWYTNAVDIWSLGVTIIEFAETKPPHHDQHPAKAMIRIIGGPPPKLSVRWPCIAGSRGALRYACGLFSPVPNCTEDCLYSLLQRSAR